MPRHLRDISESGYYHVTARGNDKKDIYYNANDKLFFLNLMRKIKKKYDIKILSYCLMDNHFHLLIFDPFSHLSDFMKSFLQSYVKYFHGTYHNSGRLFGDRYYSKVLETQTDIERTIRYIHNNPVKAHICQADHYSWSSYSEFLSSSKYCDIIDAFEIIGGIEGFKDVMETADPMDCLVSTNPSSKTDDEVRGLLNALLKRESSLSIDLISDNLQGKIFCQLRSYRITVKQIARVTGLSVNIVQRRINLGLSQNYQK